MKFLLGTRGSGITTDLILESAKFQKPILTSNRGLCRAYITKAKNLNLIIPEPISLDNLDTNTYVYDLDEILIDNLNIILYKLLKDKGLNIKNIGTVGCSLELD